MHISKSAVQAKRILFVKKKIPFRDREEVNESSEAQGTRDHPVGGVEQTDRICRIAVSPRPARYGRYGDAPARRTSVSRSLRWDNDRNPRARSATASLAGVR